MEPLPPPRHRPPRQSASSSQARDSHQGLESTPSPLPAAHGEITPDLMDQPTGSEPHPPPPQRSETSTTVKSKKRKHRGGKKRKNRRQSFAAPSEAETATSTAEVLPIDPLLEVQTTSPPPRFYRQRTGNRSDDSLDSAALLDHRDQPMMRPRRESRVTPGLYSSSHRGQTYFPGGANQRSSGDQNKRYPKSRDHLSSGDEFDEADQEPDDRTPLIGENLSRRSPNQTGFGLFKNKSRGSSKSSHRKKQTQSQSQSYQSVEQEYDVNNPPSIPNSPDIRAQNSQRNTPDTGFLVRSPDSRRNLTRDALIDIDGHDHENNGHSHSIPGSPDYHASNLSRHQSISLPVEGDVCFPAETMSELGGYDEFERSQSQANGHKRRSRRRVWPQLWALDEWSQQEKEQRAGERGVKKISEPVLIEGRLRPKKHPWHRLDEDAPYRYTYFNDDFESTIHAQTISELVQPGSSFRELFIPDPPLLSDSSESEGEEESEDKNIPSPRSQLNVTRESLGIGGRVDSLLSEKPRDGSQAPSVRGSAGHSGEQTPQKATMAAKPKKYGPRPTFWLDVQSPTEQEMRALCKAFGIHALTSEDIMMQEAREKVELFRHYYFINYRTFEQDTESEDYLEPINMYVIVFRQGILTFHFSQIPHPANVRRRIRQLTDYLILSSDWISYAIIDDITDVYQPLIHNIEAEVDDIDELILRAFNETEELKGVIENEKKGSGDSDTDEDSKRVSGIDMLRRIGECRKKVMSLYRLLGNKADVIKGFAKRCNEQWEVAPKTEIGLYLGDIQDHILTMTSNLSHYETLLSRAHSNYLAQVSIRMNERQEQTSDVLGKLTVVGTIVLPMNIICGMWGMNVKVPGQEVDNLNWFMAITAGLLLFALVCYLFCKRVYGIV